MADALLLDDQLEELIGAPAQRRVIHGTSLGAAVAVQVAAQREAEALILETPFARLCEVAEHRFPILPACLLLPGDRWDSIDFDRLGGGPHPCAARDQRSRHPALPGGAYLGRGAGAQAYDPLSGCRARARPD